MVCCAPICGCAAVAQRQGLSDSVRTGVEATLPEAMAQHYNLVVACEVFIRRKASPEPGPYPQSIKVIPRCKCGSQSLGLAAIGEGEAGEIRCGHLFEGL